MGRCELDSSNDPHVSQCARHPICRSSEDIGTTGTAGTRTEKDVIIIVGEKVFPDTAQMIAQRNAAAQAVARQNTAILNIEAAKNEALKRSSQGQYITVQTTTNPTIMRSNPIGAPVPSIAASRNLTPNGYQQQAMMPNMQTPPGVNRPLFTNTSSRFFCIENQDQNAQAASKSRSFMTGVGNRRVL